MKKLSNFFYARTNIRVCLILTTIMVAYAALIMGEKSKCFNEQLPDDLEMLDVNFSYDLEYAERLFNSLDKAGLQCYLEMVSVWDIIFPIVYGLMYLFWVSLIYKSIVKNNPQLSLLNLYPFIPILADWCENLTERNLVLEFINTKSISPENLETTLFFTQLKWGTSGLNYLLILVGIGVLVWRRFR